MGRQERVMFWRDPTLNNLEVLRATYITHSFAPHVHEGYAIGVLDSGAERFKYRGSMHVASQGDIVVINPAEMHTGEAAVEQGWSYRMLYPDTSLLQRVASEMAGGQRDYPFFPSAIIHDPALATILSDLHITLTISESALERESRLMWAFAQLITRHADTTMIPRPITAERASVLRVRAYLEEHFTENITLDQIATLANLSPFHLLRVFRDTVGLPPHCYLTQIRVMRAKRLIAASMSLAEIARAVGFSDQSHLTRHFKAITGVTPGQYALACK